MVNLTITNNLVYDGDTSFFREIVAHELTVENPKFKEATKAGRSTYGLLPVIKNFRVLPDGKIALPRGYRERLIELLTENKVPFELKDERVLGAISKSLEYDFKLRSYQHEALTAISNFSEGLLVAPAGSGKTVMGIGLIIMSGQRSLWVTHTHNLATQFTERIQSFVSNLEEKDIGFIGDGKVNLGEVVTVGLVQTLIRRPEVLEEISDYFGCVILDECHHCPATTFTQVITNFESYFVFGLTATPYRRDGLEQIMFQNIGPIRHMVPRESVEHSSGVITPVVKPVYLQTKNIVDTNYQTIITSLVNNPERNSIIVRDIISEYNAGNVIIVITDRRKHADLLFEMISKHIPAGIATGSYKKELREATLDQLFKGEIKVLVCTSQLLGEGFDFPPLNRLFLTVPFRDIVKCEQLVGRIQRPYEGKTDALIYDYVDVSHGLLKHQFKNSGTKGCRYNVYKELGCIVE